MEKTIYSKRAAGTGKFFAVVSNKDKPISQKIKDVCENLNSAVSTDSAVRWLQVQGFGVLEIYPMSV